MGFTSNTDAQISTIKSANNIQVVTVTDSGLNVNGSVSSSDSTITADTLQVNVISNTASTGITWENPFIVQNGKRYKIEFKRYEYPQTLNGLKAWIDINDTDCWDRSSMYIECLVTRRKFWGSSTTGNQYNNQKNSHFVSTMANNNVLENMRAIRTDGYSSNSQGGMIYCYEQRPEWGLGTSPFTMIAWIYSGGINSWNSIISQQSNVAGSHYVYWRYNTSNWEYAEQQTNGWTISHSQGDTYPIGKGWCMCSWWHDPANYRTRQYVHGAHAPNGAYVEATSRLVKVNFNGTEQGYQMRMEMGTSSWSGTSEEIGGDVEGYIGPVMLYNRTLTESEMTGLFDYYKPKFRISQT